MSGGGHASVSITDPELFEAQVLEFIYAEENFVTTLTVNREISQGWASFDVPHLHDDRIIILLRKPIDDTASQAEYTAIRVSHDGREISPIHWITVQNDEDYETGDIMRFAELFATHPTH